MQIFSTPESLGVTEDEILCKTGTFGVPESVYGFVRQMLEDTKPTTFSELVQIFGVLSWYRCVVRQCVRIN